MIRKKSPPGLISTPIKCVVRYDTHLLVILLGRFAVADNSIENAVITGAKSSGCAYRLLSSTSKSNGKVKYMRPTDDILQPSRNSLLHEGSDNAIKSIRVNQVTCITRSEICGLSKGVLTLFCY